MKNIFIINPAAGSAKKSEQLAESIRRAEKKTEIPCEIYFTKYGGDGFRYIREVCSSNLEEELRFFGAGGDGTLNEVVNACYGFENASAGIIPMGTGNDFIRVFESYDSFVDIECQLLGNPMDIDLISMKYEEDGEEKTAYCANMINIGFDSNVVAKAAEIRKNTPVKGSFAYLLGVLAILIKKKGADLRIELDDGFIHDGPLLLTAAANGRYCGGGVKSSPESLLDDGEIEVSVIKDVSRARFVALYPSYAKGTHMQRKHIDEILDYRKAKRLTIRTNGESMMVSNDGELIVTDAVTLEVVRHGGRFIVPLLNK